MGWSVGYVVTAKKKSSGTNVPLWFDGGIAGAEYRLGKVLDKYGLDGYGRGRPFWPGPGQRVFDRNFPPGSFGRVRPVNIHIPATGSSIQVPRYIVSSTGQVLKFIGVGTAVLGTVSTEVQYANGEISNTHRWTNHIMTIVAFLPGGVVANLLYTAVLEDAIFKGKDIFGFGTILEEHPDWPGPPAF